MIYIRFNEHKEFIEEMERYVAAGGILKNKVLRITNRIKGRAVVPFKDLSIVASYATVYDDHVSITTLNEECGELTRTQGDEATLERSKTIRSNLEKAAGTFQMEVRAGYYEFPHPL